MKNRLIIFDCFGVIFDEVAPVFLKRYLTEEKAIPLKEELFVPADLGEISYDELLTNMAKALNLNKEKMTTEWESLFKLKENMPPLIKELGKSADICLLSNAPLGVIETQFKKHNLIFLFDRIFVSCNLRMAKPDPEIYLHCVREMEKDYDEIYMIDDNWNNLSFLPQIGITPIHFKDISSLDFLLK